jgi:tRNA-intron endonuclease
MGKEPIVAVIERRGEVIYYKISKINFNQNVLKTDMKEFDF